MKNLDKSLEQATDLHKKGKIQEALKIYLKIKEESSNDAQLLFQIGNAYFQTGNTDLCLDYYKKVIEIDKEHFNAFNNMGGVLATTGKYNEAIEAFKSTINIKPDYSDAYSNIGNCHLYLKNHNDAIENFKKAIEINEKNSFAFNGLGSTYKELDDNEKAIINYRKALTIKPDYFEAYENLGTTLSTIRQFDEAKKAFEKVLEINPNHKYTFGRLLHTKMMLADWAQFDNDLKKLLDSLDQRKKVINPFPLLSLIDDPTYHKINAEIFMDDKFKNENSQIFDKNKKIEGKIKIGYFSPDFREHPTLYLMMDVFKLHDHSKFDVYAFSFGPRGTGKAYNNSKKFFKEFFDIKNMSDDEVINLSKELGIDIAIDLCGYTSWNRTSIFFKRVAPMQINYLGYAGTIGGDFIDYILADEILISENEKKYYGEKVICLPNCYQANPKDLEISNEKISRLDFGLPENKIVFCNFNSSYKITPTTFNIWTNIMKKIPDSVLWLMDSEGNSTSENIWKEAEKRSIDRNRIIFTKHMNRKDHLNRLKLVDIFLDTFPYNAHTTSSDAIRMGIPIVTLKGKSFASRVTASILNQVDMSQLVADNIEEFELKAIELATNKEKLREIKEKIKKSIKVSKLFDSLTFVKDLEKIYQKIIDEK